MAGRFQAVRRVVHRLRDAGILVSAFIDAQPRQVAAAKKAGLEICEVHTGPYANAATPAARRVQLEKVRAAGEYILNSGMQFNAGHGLDERNVGAIAALPHVGELHIGHAIVSQAVFIGLREAVARMKQVILRAREG